MSYLRKTLNVTPDDLEDLRSRLRNTRWARTWPRPPWQAGTDAETLRRLIAYWGDGYDWRGWETHINALPHRFAQIDGVQIHYLRFNAGRDDALPLLLANGWPSTFFELVELAKMLADNGFTVIVPSLPGFTFSDARPSLDQSLPTHELWHRLMHDELGYRHYGVHGGDLGAGIAGWLAQAHPESVVGLHLLDVDRTFTGDEGNLDTESRTFLSDFKIWADEEGAYAHQHRTRPMTLAQGLSDSPSGLLAWILEKYRAWSDDFASFSDDFLLTQASLYWFTNTISTSLREYYERGNGYAPTLHRVTTPTAIAWFPADLGAKPPRSWVERKYNLVRYTSMPRGGHFAAREETSLVGNDITTFFRNVHPTAA
ncbi:epoxide hydrolase family protein [Mycobacterium sp. MS1601]|uniref:epoxide hydrolase family protein n=1 Tax=Mycobacterium sp. MS1601 TaxID=1936029 RepID=UPI0012F91CA1|nr:epoxide hydrolase [Mycobacterium sp. MS1601]